MKRNDLARWLGGLLTVMALRALLPGTASAVFSEGEPIVNTTQTVVTGDSELYFPAEFTVGTAYEITVSWASVPTFAGERSGWTLQTVSDAAGQNTGDLILKTAKKNSADTTDCSVQNFTGYFTPTQSMSALNLSISGLAESNMISVMIVPRDAVANLVLDAAFSVAEGTQYLNGYFGASFEAGETYTVSVSWTDVPTYTKGATAWKIQGAADSTVDGDDTVIYRSVRNKTDNTGDQTFSGTFAPAENLPVCNFFTQYVDAGNQVRIVITKDEEASPLGTAVRVSAGDTSKYYAYAFERERAYAVTLTWEDVPVFTGSTTGWSLQTAADTAGSTVGDLVIKAAKKQSDTGTGTSVQTYSGIFVPTADMTFLELSVQGLVTDNNVSVSVTPASAEEDVLLDATISVDAAMEYISAFFDVEFKAGKIYNVNASWSTSPIFTDANEGKTAWKVQAAENSSVFGDDSVIYKITAADHTAPQSYRGIFHCEADKSVFNFFAQRLNGANEVHLVVKDAGQAATPDYESDPVTYEVLYTIPNYVEDKVIQGFDIYNGVLFQCYDEGYCATYDFDTGTQIAAFPLGSAYSTNHCGNANFGNEFPQGNTQFPALYVSGDLTTKACYVESVSTTGSQLVQTIYFDINPSYTGGQVIVDKGRNRLLYMQREDSRIRYLGNRFKISEFRIPALSEGSEIHFTNADILGEPYELEYYSPLYQGATIYRGAVLQTHGLCANSFGSTVGIMYFDALTHSFDRHIDLTGKTSHEPQSVAVYQDRLIINFVNGTFYELKLDLDVPTSGYVIAQAENVDELVASLTQAVGAYLAEGFSAKSAVLSADFVMTGNEQAFTAEVVIQTPYNCQAITVTGIVNS